MKKFFIPFVFLLGFLIFVPQITLADVLVMYTPQETHKKSHDIVKSLLCFYNKKINTPNYEIKKLKLIEVPYYTSDPSLEYQPSNTPDYQYLTDAVVNSQDICNQFPNEEEREEEFPTSICNNGVCREQKLSKTCKYVKYNDSRTYNENKKDTKYTVNSFVYDCKEYIKVYSNTSPGIRESYGYDVTDVPPGSYLKFIPETKEVHVISNKDDSYKKDIPSKISLLRIEEKKFHKEIKKDNIKAFFKKNVNKIRYGAETKEKGEILDRVKSLECLGKKKSKLSQKYFGKDIKLKSCDKYKSKQDTNDFYYNICFGIIDFLVMTENQYFIYGDELTEEYSEQENTGKILLGRSSSPNGYHNNCHEYIRFSIFDTKSKLNTKYFADVTNVPENSYLQYISEKETLKVISPGDENYQNIAKKYKEKQKNKTREEHNPYAF